MNTAELKALVGMTSDYTERESLSFSLCSERLPRGALIEITGFGKCEFVTRFLAENPTHHSVWLESELSINPFACLQRRVDLEKIFFVEAKEYLFWATTQILNSSLYDTVVVNCPRWSFKQLRQMQLRSEKSNSFVFLLNKRACGAWPISMSLDVKHAFFSNEVKVEVTKKKVNYA